MVFLRAGTKTPVTRHTTMVEWTEDLFPNATNIQPHEPPEDYRTGGFHPVALGDTFQDGRFVVRHKLGFGGQATVWLARDTRQRYNHRPSPISRVGSANLGQQPMGVVEDQTVSYK